MKCGTALGTHYNILLFSKSSEHWLTHHTMSCSGDVTGSGGNSCLGGRTTVGMMRLWRDVSSSVASSRIYEKRYRRSNRLLFNDFCLNVLWEVELHIDSAFGQTITHPACSLKHFEVQWISRQLAIYFCEWVAGGHTSHKLGLDKILLVGIFLWQEEAGGTGAGRWRTRVRCVKDATVSDMQ